MNIILADHYGLCFGVRDALRDAERLAMQGPMTTLGELVHNPLALARLDAHGVHRGRLDELTSAPTRRVLITAHGASDERRRAWQEAGFDLTDTTCPLVRRAHRQLAALVAAGYFPVVVGRADHVEVRGLTGDFPEAVVIEREAEIPHIPSRPRFGVIAQTTQPSDKVARMVEALRAARPEAEVRYCDTVCQPTKDRQAALRTLIARVEMIVVVGGRHSNNTRQLVLTAEAAGRPARQIECAEELEAAWFEGIETVGLTAGTSTLPETVCAVHARLETIARRNQRGVSASLAPAAPSE